MNEWVALFRSLTADNVDNVDNVVTEDARSRDSVNKVNIVSVSKEEEEKATVSLLAASLAALERRRPDHIEAADWQQAVEDGRRFLTRWGEQAAALGWVETDVFSLPPVPKNPHPMWRRLARVDELGLVWLTHGKPVIALTSDSAAIAASGGGKLHYYKKVSQRGHAGEGNTPPHGRRHDRRIGLKRGAQGAGFGRSRTGLTA